MLVALTGRKSSGKDYLASYLISAHGFVRVSFSDQLKMIADNIYPWSAPNLEVKPEDKEKIIDHPHNVNRLTYRELWMSLDKLREVDPAVFVHNVERLVSELHGYGSKVLITDIRKQIEFDLCESLKFQTIRINNMVDPTSDPSEDIIETFNVEHEFDHHKLGVYDFADFCCNNLDWGFKR